MEIKINSVIPGQARDHQVEVFGYNSKSQPGLEINGLNGKGRLIKEKITFLSKKRKLKYPLKRFVLCVEGDGLEKSQVEFLELPLLICFWSMAGFLPLKRLDNCFTAGKVSLDGDIYFKPLTEEFFKIMEFSYGELLCREDRLLLLGKPGAGDTVEGMDYFHLVDVIELLNQSVGGFKVK